jgi:hypothetical protein
MSRATRETNRSVSSEPTHARAHAFRGNSLPLADFFSGVVPDQSLAKRRGIEKDGDINGSHARGAMD